MTLPMVLPNAENHALCPRGFAIDSSGEGTYSEEAGTRLIWITESHKALRCVWA